MKIKFNGCELDVEGPYLSYEAIHVLAEGHENEMLTVTYSVQLRPNEYRRGALYPGKSVELVEGMIINAMNTGNG